MAGRMGENRGKGKDFPWYREWAGGKKRGSPVAGSPVRARGAGGGGGGEDQTRSTVREGSTCSRRAASMPFLRVIMA